MKIKEYLLSKTINKIRDLVVYDIDEELYIINLQAILIIAGSIAFCVFAIILTRSV